MKHVMTLATVMAMGLSMPALAGSQSTGGSMSGGAATGMSSGSASAGQGSMDQRAQYYLKLMDKNNDNMVSKDEHEQFGENMFKQADTNGDDELSMNEIRTQKQKEMQQMQQSMSQSGGASGTTGSMSRTGS